MNHSADHGLIGFNKSAGMPFPPSTSHAKSSAQTKFVNAFLSSGMCKIILGYKLVK